MINSYPFNPGDWIMVEDEFAKVESIFPMYYESFDSDVEGDAKIGDYKQTVISYHSFCNLRGRVGSSKAHIKYLDFCDWIKPLTTEQNALLEQIKSKKIKAFTDWVAKCKDAKDYIPIYVKVEKGYDDVALSKFRKAAKALPERFTFSEVQTILRSIPEIKANTASTEECSKDFIYFELCYILKEQERRQLSFYRIREFSRFMDMSTFINFEGVFVSLYQLVRLYCQEFDSEKLNELAERLKKASFALFNQDFKNDLLAKDFFEHAPKIFYTFETAYSTIETFLERNAKDLGVEDFAELVRSRDERILKMYHQVLGI